MLHASRTGCEGDRDGGNAKQVRGQGCAHRPGVEDIVAQVGAVVARWRKAMRYQSEMTKASAVHYELDNVADVLHTL
jgi:hypothetical protein